MIQSTFLTDIANYTNNNIAKVVINGTIEITSFIIKKIDGSAVTMQYMIQASLVSMVTKIDLKNTSGQIISSNDVYIPITTDTLLLQTIHVKEAS